jgi:putative ABC transport system permease protein
MLLLLIAATGALFLGALGVYGIVSYTVSRRTHEIGIRIALGARAADVGRMVLRQGSVVVLSGLAVGVLIALAVSRLLGSLLFEVSPTDPWTIAAMSVLLLVVALVASYFPTRRAARVDPVIALRSEW